MPQILVFAVTNFKIKIAAIPHAGIRSKLGVYASILSQALREGCERKSFCLPLAKD